MRPGLKGIPPVSQGMNPPLKTANRVFSRGYVQTYGPGSATWTCPETGSYRFIVNGGGGGGDGTNGGGGGSQSIKVRRVNAGETVAVSVAATVSNQSNGANTTATFADGSVVTAGGGVSGASTAAGGTAAGGDINTSGSAGSGATGGAGGSSGLYGLGGGPGGPGGGTGSTSSVGGLVIMRESA